MSAKISIRIDEQGMSHFDVSGVEGESCTNLTEAIMRALGEVEETEHHEEFIQENPDWIHNMEG